MSKKIAGPLHAAGTRDFSRVFAAKTNATEVAYTGSVAQLFRGHYTSTLYPTSGVGHRLEGVIAQGLEIYQDRQVAGAKRDEASGNSQGLFQRRHARARTTFRYRLIENDVVR